MAIIILLVLVLFTFGIASRLLRTHVATWVPVSVPDNVIRIEDWEAALEQRRLQAAQDQAESIDTTSTLPTG